MLHHSTLPAPSVHIRRRRVIVFNVETTGFQRYDRIITLGAVRIEGTEIVKALHFIFDPRKDSHPDALRLHGWCNWTTRFQDLFADHAKTLHRWFSWADEIVAHNAEFDLHFLQREFRKAGVDPLTIPVFCTMKMSRERWPGRSARLDDCLQRIGLSRSSSGHGALEDAVLTACLYLGLTQGNSRWIEMARQPRKWPLPSNLRPVPPRPEGALPRRSPKRPMKSKE